MAQLYRALDSDKHEIRLLSLLPIAAGDGLDAPLRCELLYRSLDNAGDYEGLSYVWGKPEFTEPVQLSGHEVRITKNLDTALRYLRLDTGPRILWVDALCINQEDIDERSHQVTLMKNIYQHCTRDLVWLGPTEDDDQSTTARRRNADESHVEKAFELMEKIISKSLDNTFEFFPRRSRYKAAPPTDVETVHLLDSQADALQHTFSYLPIWHRIWVVQEMACAPEVRLLHGHLSLEWSRLSGFLSDQPYADAFHEPWSHSYSPIIKASLGKVQSLEQQRRILRDAEAGPQSTLLNVLARFKDLQATDPRDRIYGLLGLVNEQHSIRVDYKKSARQVFQDVTEFFINTRGDLDIICQNPWQETDSPSDPSWAPNFEGRHYYSQYYGLMNILFAQRSIYSAGLAQCAVPAVIREPGLLQVRGTFLGKVGPVLQHDFAQADSARAWPTRAHLPHDWMALHFGTSLLQDTKTQYFTGESRLRAFWRTLVLDCKAYPIQRLCQGEIEADEEVWDEILQFDGRRDDAAARQLHTIYERLNSNSMWTRSYSWWTFSVSKQGYFIMLRSGAKEDDVIAILNGGKVPMVLREVEGRITRQKRYIVVNPVYVHGFMDGEATSHIDQGLLREQNFWLA